MSASDAPVREPGTRARSGNAMGRTRSALLTATAECLGRYGIRKTTMVDVASRSGVAKATLYNHFRTKEDLLAALVEDRVSALVAAAVETAGREGLAAALAATSAALAEDPALRRATLEEPGLLAPLLTPGAARGWQLARDGVVAVLGAARLQAGPSEVELVLRWVTSQVTWPALDPGTVVLLVAGLSAVPLEVPAVASTPEMAPTARPALGWPAG